MNKNSGFLKGMGAGMAAGALLVTVGKMAFGKKSSNLSKGSSKAVRAIGDFVDGVSCMLK